MGEIRVIDGMLEHRINTAEPAVWERIGYDAEGAAIPGIWHGDDVRVLVDETAGNVIMHIGGTWFSFPSEVGVQCYDALGPAVPQAKAIKVDALVAAEDDRLVGERERLRRDHQAEVNAMASSSEDGAALAAALEAKRGEIAAAQQLLERKLAEVEETDAKIRGG